MVGAIGIHDRELLAAAILGAGLGDIGDLAVEERALARQPRIDHVGALVRSAAPFVGANDIALPRQLAAECDVVEVAAHGELAVPTCLDEALHQHFRRAPAPAVKGRRGNLREIDGGQRIGADRLEQPVVAQIVEHHARHIAPQRLGVAAFGCGGDAFVGRECRNGNAEILPFALIGD